MEDADLRGDVDVAHLGDAFEILIAVEANARRKPVVIVGDECRRRHLGGDGQRERFGKRLTIDIRAEILAGGDGTVVLFQVKVAPAAEKDVLAALVDISGRQSPVEQSGKAGRGEILCAAAIAEVATGRPAALGEVLRAKGGIHAAVNDQVERVAKDRSLGRGSAEDGDEQPALPRLRAPGV